MLALRNKRNVYGLVFTSLHVKPQGKLISLSNYNYRFFYFLFFYSFLIESIECIRLFQKQVVLSFEALPQCCLYF